MQKAAGKRVGRPSLLANIMKHRICYLMIAPFMIVFTVFTMMPLFASLALGFTYFDLISAPKFVGLMNFTRMFLEDELLQKAVLNTIKFAFITGPVSYILCILFAWLINELPRTLRVIATVVFYIPSLSGSVYVVWKYIFSADSYGLLNFVMMRLGLLQDPVAWLSTEAYVMPIVMIVSVWLSLGTSFLANIAGLQGIDRSLYEAGAVDGIRNRWQELTTITLPSMTPFLMFGAVMQIAVSFTVGDVASQLVGYPSVNYSAHTVMLHITEMGRNRFEMGYACAIAFMLSVVMIAIRQLVAAALRRYDS